MALKNGFWKLVSIPDFPKPWFTTLEAAVSYRAAFHI